MGGLCGKRWGCAGHFAVADAPIRVILQRVDPGVAHAIGKLLLLAPQHLVRQVARKGLPQDPLLDAAGGHLPGRVHRHGHIQEFLVEEGNPGFDPPRRHGLVGPQAVELVKSVEFADGFLMEGARVGRPVEVQVAAEHLVGPFARQHHLDPQGADATGHQVHGRGRAHGGHVEGLQVMDDVRQRVESFLHREVELVVDGADVVGHEPGAGHVRRAFQADTERVETWPPRLGPVVILDPVPGVHLGHGGDDRGVEPPGQQDAVGHIGHELPVHRGLQGFADRRRVGVGRSSGVAPPFPVVVGSGGSFERIQEVPGRKLGDASADGRERLHFGRHVEAALIVVARVEGDDSQVVARDEVPVQRGVVEDEGEDSVQFVEEAGSLFCVQRKDYLAIALSLEPERARQVGFQRPVVVDLAVDGQCHAPVRAAEWL